MNDKKTMEFVQWHREMYGDTSKETWTWEIAVVYSENPEQTEKEHMELWKKKIGELMWRDWKKKYTHRGWRTETYADAQFSSLWLYCGPIFKNIKEKENDVNKDTATWQEKLWELW